jgi:hypothetical protein
VYLLDGFAGDVEFTGVASLFNGFVGVAEGGVVVEGGDDPVDGRGDEDAVLGGDGPRRRRPVVLLP